MNLYQCEKYAQSNGFDSLEFIAYFPVGAKKCKWLDAYFGMFEIEGMDGFITSKEIDKMFPSLECKVIE